MELTLGLLGTCLLFTSLPRLYFGKGIVHSHNTQLKYDSQAWSCISASFTSSYLQNVEPDLCVWQNILEELNPG